LRCGGNSRGVAHTPAPTRREPTAAATPPPHQITPVPDRFMMRNSISKQPNGVDSRGDCLAFAIPVPHAWKRRPEQMRPEYVGSFIPNVEQTCPESEAQLRNHPPCFQWFCLFHQCVLRSANGSAFHLFLNGSGRVHPTAYVLPWTRGKARGNCCMQTVSESNLEVLQRWIQRLTQPCIPYVSRQGVRVVGRRRSIFRKPLRRQSRLCICKRVLYG